MVVNGCTVPLTRREPAVKTCSASLTGRAWLLKPRLPGSERPRFELSCFEDANRRAGAARGRRQLVVRPNLTRIRAGRGRSASWPVTPVAKRTLSVAFEVGVSSETGEGAGRSVVGMA